MIWGNGQFYMAPRIDYIKSRAESKGVDYWVNFGKEHGFVGPSIQCASLPLQNMGMRDLIARSTFAEVWVWPDANFVPAGGIGIPSGGLMGDEAKRYYDGLAHVLKPVAHKIFLTIGSDILEWVGSGDS